MPAVRLVPTAMAARIQASCWSGLKPETHLKRLLAWSKPKEAELVFRKGKLFFDLVVKKELEMIKRGRRQRCFARFSRPRAAH
jgi:hypothetical protein